MNAPDERSRRWRRAAFALHACEVSDPEHMVRCGEHGETPATFVCRHLQLGVGCGFHCSGENPDDAWPDAWCDGCDAALGRDGVWSESNEPEIGLLCTGCYERVRARNAVVPEPLVPGQVTVTEADYSSLMQDACERAAVRQEKAKKKWRFTERRRWHFDDVDRTLRFFDEPGGETIVADVTITGSFSTRTNTWMWAWGNDQYTTEQRFAVQAVRTFGEVRGIPKLADVHWPAEEVDAWEVTQLAADLLGAEAIYRAPMEHMLVFMLLDNFRTVHPS